MGISDAIFASDIAIDQPVTSHLHLSVSSDFPSEHSLEQEGKVSDYERDVYLDQDQMVTEDQSYKETKNSEELYGLELCS